VTLGGGVVVAGYNDNGQCGVGSTAQVRTPASLEALAGERIVGVAAANGCEHSLLITHDGRVFAFGYNYRGQLGLVLHCTLFLRTVRFRLCVSSSDMYLGSYYLGSDTETRHRTLWRTSAVRRVQLPPQHVPYDGRVAFLFRAERRWSVRPRGHFGQEAADSGTRRPQWARHGVLWPVPQRAGDSYRRLVDVWQE
jgi:hypothetical protein